MKRQEPKVQPAKAAASNAVANNEAKGRKLPGDGEVFDPPESEIED